VAAALDAFVVEYPDFEWQTAALYYKALSYQDHGITWINAPNPFDPDSDDPDIVDLYYLYQDKLLEKAQPWEDSAVLQYKAVVDFAKQKKRYTVWVGKALEELNRVDPNTFPVPKPESTTVIESDSASTPSFIEEVETTSARPQDDDGIRYAGLRAAP